MRTKQHLTFAIGDIHGRFDLLQRVATEINLAADRMDAIADVITLGDYIDRGPQSREVINFLMAGSFTNGTLRNLKGNHEEMAIEGYSMWGHNGGIQTINSYPDRVMDPAHIAWMKSLPLFIETDKHFFVHAGINPDHTLDGQSDEAMLWIREPFLSYREKFPKYVVTGHTPVHEPHVRHNRAGLDTGAFATGNLSFGVFTADREMPVATAMVTMQGVKWQKY